MKQHFHQAGFSLIELITVVSITAIVSLVSVSVLINSQLRNTKASTISKVREEGEFAVREMSYLLRNARYILPNQFGQTCSENMGAIRVALGDGNIIELYTDASSRIASNSGSLITTPPASYITTTSVKMKDALSFSCRQEPYQGGALIDFSFTLASGDEDVVSQDSFYEQQFSSRVYVRSYQ